jgi:3'-phosphoadenosine 5'-phosphosulfate sulfotransferase (PAPS reductase)/FAD synthetase
MRTCKHDHEALASLQALSLRQKIFETRQRIAEWVKYFGEDGVYVAFSGGKDSTVLLDIVRSDYPDIPAVFINTGREFPEIVRFVRQIDNVTWLRPTRQYEDVITNYGYPMISKKIAMGIDRFNNTKSDEQKRLRLWGGINPTSGKKQAPTISQKWHFLTKAPFKLSERCCYFLKKAPLKKYEKNTGRAPMEGTMAFDSDDRKATYIKRGCNAFGSRRSMPLAFWTELDIWDYVKKYDLPISSVYEMGYDRTGCMDCGFGAIAEQEKGENRFERMKRTHPKRYAYMMDDLNYKLVLPYCGIRS